MKKQRQKTTDLAVREGLAEEAQIKWKGTQIRIKHRLPLQEMMELVQTVVDSCFHVDTGEYLPELQGFLTMSCYVRYFTDYTLPEDLEAQYTILMETDLPERISVYINEKQSGEILNAIQERIAYRISCNAQELSAQVARAMRGLEDLGSQMENALRAIDPKFIETISTVFADGKPDEQAIVKAVMQARKTDA